MINLSQYIGKPFRWGARGPDAYDCWGLARSVMEQYGYKIPDYLYEPEDHAGIAKLVQYVEANNPLWVPTDDPIPGDLVMMGPTPRLQHAGVLTEEGLIHTSLRYGVLIQPLRRTIYRCTRSYRWVG